MLSITEYNGLLINNTFIELMEQYDVTDLESLMSTFDGCTIKIKKTRSIFRIDKGKRSFYLKQHEWSWIEKIKYILPWVKKEDARNEWSNIILLNKLGFSTVTPVAFGEKRKYGLPCISITLTEDLYDSEKLESYIPRKFSGSLSGKRLLAKRELIHKLAYMTRQFHESGLNHQDYYFGHLYIRSQNDALIIIDLQRLHRNNKISNHDRIKDLAQLAYSATISKVFTRTDFIRFAHTYLEKEKLNSRDIRLLKKINSKMKRIARHDNKLKRRSKGNP